MKKNINIIILIVGLFIIIIATIIIVTNLYGVEQQPKNNIVEEKLIPIRIAYPSVGTLISGQVGIVLEKTDILKNNGFNAEVISMTTGSQSKTALVGNKVDVIFTSQANFPVLLSSGFKCYAIATLGSAGEMGLVTNINSEIYSVSDLKGGKIGTLFGTSVHKPAIEWVKQAGLTPDKDVKIINIGGAGALRSALASNNIEAIVNWDPYLTDGLNKENQRLLAKDDLDLVTVMSKSYIDNHPNVILKFRKALKEAVFYMSQHKDEVNSWYSEYAKLDIEFIDQVSSVNKNYIVKTIDEINISISDELAEKMDRIGQFLYDEKLIDSILIR